MSGDRQWIRTCSLLVGTASGEGLDLSGLRVQFQTTKGDIETPNSATITITNLSKSTASRIGGEFTTVFLSAGYQGNAGLIFSGNIRQVRTGRENGTESWLEMTAADGDHAYAHATVSTTLAAGARPVDQVAVAGKSMAEKGVTTGHIADIGGQPLPRGKVMHGMARKYLRDVGQDRGAVWSIQDGALQMVRLAGYLPGEAVVLTHETGLLGMPEQTDQGIKVTCLLNPRLRIGGRIKLNNESIQRAKTPLTIGAWNKSAMIDSDGIYRLIKADFKGDTHGQDWTADLLAIGMDDTMHIPLDQIGV
ncbi:phage protein [Rhodospirillum sp. A1_3_36]|uniref:phage protein n=1 Tax=Rhodospirillum sp. A1_3_36 TaxID=3391666 RepID=UPI0039A43A0E